MKKVFLLIFLFPFFLYGQDIDKSLYQECTLTEASANRQNNPERIQYYKSQAHFYRQHTNTVMGYIQVIFYQDTVQFSSFNCYFYLPSIKPFQVAVIFYRFERGPSGGFYSTLDHIELTDNYFVVGTRYKIMENLRLRRRGSLSSDILQTIGKGEWVTVLEEGNEETIDGLTSIWVKIRLRDNNEGWCFGGYLGLDF
jgi:hypothetical protein